MKKSHIPLNLYAPKYWGTWFGIFLLRCFSFLPHSWMKKLSVILGNAFYNLAKKRTHIIETNINLCFPEKTPEEKQELSQQAFNSAIMAIFETALTWWGSRKRFMRLHKVKGMEHLTKASAKGKGVILLAPHFTTLEISGAFLNSHIDNLKVVYKRSNNPLMEYFIQNKREQKCCSGIIKHKSLREIVRSVKKGNVVSFSPDQDFGVKDSIFAPFMGVTTSTLLSTQRLAKLTGAPVLPYYAARLNDQAGYEIRFGPEFENFPSDDELRDATMVNQAIEEQVLQSPEQYLWAHRRFKTRPEGEKDVYTT